MKQKSTYTVKLKKNYLFFFHAMVNGRFSTRRCQCLNDNPIRWFWKIFSKLGRVGMPKESGSNRHYIKHVVGVGWGLDFHIFDSIIQKPESSSLENLRSHQCNNKQSMYEKMLEFFHHTLINSEPKCWGFHFLVIVFALEMSIDEDYVCLLINNLYKIFKAKIIFFFFIYVVDYSHKLSWKFYKNKYFFL